MKAMIRNWYWPYGPKVNTRVHIVNFRTGVSLCGKVTGMTPAQRMQVIARVENPFNNEACPVCLRRLDMGNSLSDWLVKHGWRQLDGKTLYSAEGERFHKPEGYAAHGEVWLAPVVLPPVTPGNTDLRNPVSAGIAGYFVDEENASHEYVFGPAAKQLAKAIEKFNKENEG